ncbi:hypothetical protein [Pseudorhodoferax sp. Leaf267]|uniref:hypothetical protein n=1 Tax=Pseudorhodoferax sp. Leaf267 TaxID=1736316 RepID=UPI0006FEDE74|nr:hypothetical protein [Pseudorhodoferax sp. Leaf267]KQP23400.1 hypothetical protein ASF43_05955 [Pseudorhodoferax sp. Leaf267]
MRKLVFLVVFMTGVGLGWLSARHDATGLQIGMMAVGALFGAAIGGGLCQIGLRRPWQRPIPTEEEMHPIPRMGMSGRDMAANYWRDKGHPPFMKPPRPEYGLHMFDADKRG